MTTSEIKLSKNLENGKEFSCKMCGTCCRGLHEGEVYLYRDDIVKLARHLKLKGKLGLRAFARNYVKIIDESFYWKESGEKRGRNYKFKTLAFKFTGDDEHCYFLDENNICTVHKARPFQCRCFPWWRMMVNSSSGWKNLVNYSKKCPGLHDSLSENHKGKFYSREEILKWAKREYAIEKKFFLEMKNNDFDIFKVYDFISEETNQQ
ncbi:MAG: YkgJ family cysteine cluster protein [Candidatus Thorarchaeota archaeon]